MFGVVSDPKMKDRVSVTLVATGVGENPIVEEAVPVEAAPALVHTAAGRAANGSNGHAAVLASDGQRVS